MILCNKIGKDQTLRVELIPVSMSKRSHN